MIGSRIDRHDAVLLGIVAGLLGGASVGVFTSVTFRDGLAAGSAFSTLFLYEGLFRNPPVTTSPTRDRATAIAWHAYLLVLGVGYVT